LAAVLLVTAVGSATAATRTRLVIFGAFHTTSSRAVVWNESCSSRPNRTLLYESNPLRLGRSSAVATVQFFIRRFRGPAPYAATMRAPYGRTAVQVVTGRNASTGVASAFYVATSGSISVLRAKDVGRRGHSAELSGSVHAKLRKQGGSQWLGVNGTWHCRIEPTANGG
jgi:hypothetical protein